MLTTIRNEWSGDIEGVCEWTIADQFGHPNIDGQFVWVYQLEVYRHVDGPKVIQQMIREILTLAPNCLYGYWVRRDKTGETQQHIFRRAQFENLVEEEVRV